MAPNPPSQASWLLKTSIAIVHTRPGLIDNGDESPVAARGLPVVVETGPYLPEWRRRTKAGRAEILGGRSLSATRREWIGIRASSEFTLIAISSGL